MTSAERGNIYPPLEYFHFPPAHQALFFAHSQGGGENTVCVTYNMFQIHLHVEEQVQGLFSEQMFSDHGSETLSS